MIQSVSADTHTQLLMLNHSLLSAADTGEPSVCSYTGSFYPPDPSPLPVSLRLMCESLSEDPGIHIVNISITCPPELMQASILVLAYLQVHMFEAFVCMLVKQGGRAHAGWVSVQLCSTSG